MSYQITHPHAQTALLLASFNQPDRPWINRMLAVSGTPRRLYTLARVLRAAQTMDEIDRISADNFTPMLMACSQTHEAALREMNLPDSCDQVPARDLSEWLEIHPELVRLLAAQARKLPGMPRHPASSAKSIPAYRRALGRLGQWLVCLGLRLQPHAGVQP